MAKDLCEKVLCHVMSAFVGLDVHSEKNSLLSSTWELIYHSSLTKLESGLDFLNTDRPRAEGRLFGGFRVL